MQKTPRDIHLSPVSLEQLRKTLLGKRASEEKKPVATVQQDAVKKKKPGHFLKVFFLILLAVVCFVLVYLFLLLGEPDEDAKYKAAQQEERITSPMASLEMPGASDPAILANSFGHPVLSVQGGVSWQKARIEDVSFGKEYARKVTITYAFEDGSILQALSIRPTDAVSLLKGSSYTLDENSLYTLGGLTGARMDNGITICIFAQSEDSVYAILCPSQHGGDLDSIIRQSTLISPTE